MQSEPATVPLLPPLVAYALRTSWVDVILYSDAVDLDSEAKIAVAKDLIAHMDRTGETQACLVSVP